MILHLLFDDKFGEYAVRQFSEPEMCSEFILVSHSKAPVCPHKYEGVKIVFEDQEGFQNLLLHLGEYKAIILHGLFYPWQERVLRAVPASVKVAWVFWGGEIFGRSDIGLKFLSRASKQLLSIQILKRFLKGKSISHNYEIPFDLLKRIEYCLTDVPEDFAFAKEYLETDFQELWYNYYSVEETIGDLVDSKCDGNNILIGNSCSLQCNHFDGFRAIKRLRLPANARVYVPLSYGEPWLQNTVTKWGRLLFGDCFVPLLSFLPRNEYNAIIKSCAVVVMPHFRPQAFGNILTALWLGSRVFLSEQNVLLSFFNRIGAVVFSIEQNLNNKDIIWAPLSEKERTQNRNVISALYNKEVMRDKNLEIIRVLNQ